MSQNGGKHTASNKPHPIVCTYLGCSDTEGLKAPARKHTLMPKKSSSHQRTAFGWFRFLYRSAEHRGLQLPRPAISFTVIYSSRPSLKARTIYSPFPNNAIIITSKKPPLLFHVRQNFTNRIFCFLEDKNILLKASVHIHTDVATE